MPGEVVKFNEGMPAPRRPFEEVLSMAAAFAKSGMFGAKTQDQALALMLMAEAEGKHVATAMQDYDVIQGRPALKADAMLGRFQLAGGHVKWTCETDEKYSGIFSHPSCDPHEIGWDMARAKAAGIVGKDNWKKYPRQMLRARTIAEGVRSTFPACLRGAPHYVSEEVQDFEPVATPTRPVAQDAPVPALTDAGVETPTPAPASTSVRASFTATAESDGLGKGKSAYQAKKDGDWDRVSKRLMEELGECSTRGDAVVWWEGVVQTDDEYRALPESWRKTFRDESYIPHMETLGDGPAPQVVFEDAQP